jgi:hypothetical protein
VTARYAWVWVPSEGEYLLTRDGKPVGALGFVVGLANSLTGSGWAAEVFAPVGFTVPPGFDVEVGPGGTVSRLQSHKLMTRALARRTMLMLARWMWDRAELPQFLADERIRMWTWSVIPPHPDYAIVEFQANCASIRVKA